MKGRQSGVVLWFVTPEAERVRLYQDFPVTFYVGGAENELKKAGVFLRSHFPAIQVFFTQRQGPLPPGGHSGPGSQNAAGHHRPPGTARLRSTSPRWTTTTRTSPSPSATRARFGTFPLAHCRVAHAGGNLQSIEIMDSPWDFDPPAPPLRILQLDLDSDPRYSQPEILTARFDDKEQRIPIRYESSSLIRLNTILTNYDPDLLLTNSGEHLAAAAPAGDGQTRRYRAAPQPRRQTPGEGQERRLLFLLRAHRLPQPADAAVRPLPYRQPQLHAVAGLRPGQRAGDGARDAPAHPNPPRAVRPAPAST